jgi:hypothetical protein
LDPDGVAGEEKWTHGNGQELGYLSGIALSYRLDDRGFESRQGLGIFLFTAASTPVLGPTQPPIQSVPGAFSLGVKRPEREEDHSPPSSGELKNAWSYTSTPQYTFMALCSVKAQGQLYLYLLWKWQWNIKMKPSSVFIGGFFTTHRVRKHWPEVKLFICLTKYHAMKTYWRSGGTAPLILNFRNRWRWLVSLTARPLYPQG